MNEKQTLIMELLKVINENFQHAPLVINANRNVNKVPFRYFKEALSKANAHMMNLIFQNLCKLIIRFALPHTSNL